MNIAVNRAKIVVPRRRSDLLSRQRLLDLLIDLLDYRLTLVSAPAGYGKTSLLVDFAHQEEYPICWYALEDVDQDLQRFLAHLISAIKLQFPDFGNNSFAVIKSIWETDLDENHLITTIVNEIYEHITEHFVVILDDFHLVDNSEEINRFVSRFIQLVDENCHLIIATRTMGNLPDLPLMVGRSQVKNLNFEDLAFQAEEIQALLQKNYHQSLSDEDAVYMYSQTEGWITGLLLSAETMWREISTQVSLARVAGVTLYEYLAQQVFEQQTSQIQDFLLTTSLLDEFNAELCKAVFGEAPKEQSWSELIAAVLQYNLFVQPVDSGGTWLRYHHLFREFLQDLMMQEQPELAYQILLSLVEIFCEQQEWEKAYAICQRLDDDEVTLNFITRAGLPLLRNGRYSILAKWIDDYHENVMLLNPKILAIRGAIALYLGEIGRGLSLINEANVHLQHDQDYLSRTFIWRAFAYCKQGKYRDALHDANQAIALTRNIENSQGTHAEALEAKGESLYFLGRPEEAMQHIEQALAIFAALNDHDYIAYSHMVLGYVKMNSGSYETANKHFLTALDIYLMTNNAVRQSNLYLNLGASNIYLGDFANAQIYLNKALKIAKQLGYIPGKGHALTHLGVVYAELSLFDLAKELFGQAKIIAQQTEKRSLILFLELQESKIARAHHKIDQAQLALKSVEKLVRQNEASEIMGWVALEKGCIYLAKGEVIRAIRYLEEAVNTLDAVGLHPDVGEAHLYLACAYHASGDERKTALHLYSASQSAAMLDNLHPLIAAGRETKEVLEAVKNSPEVGEFATQLIETIKQFDREIPHLRRQIRQQSQQMELSQPEITVQALGGTHVSINGKEINKPEWTKQKSVRELFYLLVAHPKGLKKEAIGDILWPNSVHQQHYKQLNNAVYRLRRALGKDVVVFDSQNNCYQFNWEMDYQYDVEAFQYAVEQAQRGKNTSQKIAASKQAIDLYQGPYLPDVDGIWAIPMREFLRRTFSNVVILVAELYFKNEKYEEALGYCQQILYEDSCHETAHRLIMRVYAAKGNRSEVAKQYERCKQALQMYISVKPSPETEILFKQLMGK